MEIAYHWEGDYLIPDLKLFNQIHRKFTISRLRHLYITSNQTVAI